MAKYTLREQLQTLAGQLLSQSEIAARLGVSPRTIRRWKNEGVTPSASHSDAVKTLSKLAANARAKVKRQHANYSDVDQATGKRISAPIKPPKSTGYIPVGTRRKLRDKPIGKEPRRKYRKGEAKQYRTIWSHKLSDYTMYDVRPMNQDEQIEFAYALLQSGEYVRFVYTTREYDGRTAQYVTGQHISPELIKPPRPMTLADFRAYIKIDTHGGFGRAVTGKAARIISAPINKGKRKPRHYK